MEHIQENEINLEPLHRFFKEWISPTDFSGVLDELLIDYMSLVIKMQTEGSDSDSIHENTNQFIFYLKTLRDILPGCEKA